MMKVYIYRLVLAGLMSLWSNAGMGQVSKSAITHFPVHIVQRIHEVISITPVSEVTQMKLGTHFMQQDSLAALALHQTGLSDTLGIYFRTSVEELRNILSSLEFNAYKLKMIPRSSSRLRKVVLQKEALHLTPKQVDHLLKESDRLERMKEQKKEDIRAIEQRKADSILTHAKYLTYYEQENQEKASKTVKKWLTDLKRNYLMRADMDSAKLYQPLFRFESEQQAIISYWKDYGDKEKIKEAQAHYEALKPRDVQRVEIYKQLPSWSMIREIILKRDTLSLNLDENTLDTLLATYNTYLKVRQQKKAKKEKFSDRGLECKLIVPILTMERINKLLVAKRRIQAEKNALKRIPILEKYELVNNSNRKDILKELTDYELKLEVAQEWVNIERSQENLFKLCDVKDHKPVVLQELDRKEKGGKKENRENIF